MSWDDLLFDIDDFSMKDILQVIDRVLGVVRVLVVERVARINRQLNHDSVVLTLICNRVADPFKRCRRLLRRVRWAGLEFGVSALVSLRLAGLAERLRILWVHVRQDLLFACVSHRVEHLWLDALVSGHSEVRIELEEALHDFDDLEVDAAEAVLQRLDFLLERSVLGASCLLVIGIFGLNLRWLELSHVLDRVWTCQEAKIVITLLSYAPQNDLDLIGVSNHVHLFWFAAFVLRVLVLAWWERKAGAALKQISLLLKFLLELISIFMNILKKLENDAPKAPHIRRVIILFLD